MFYATVILGGIHNDIIINDVGSSRKLNSSSHLALCKGNRCKSAGHPGHVKRGVILFDRREPAIIYEQQDEWIWLRFWKYKVFEFAALYTADAANGHTFVSAFLDKPVK